MDRKSKPQTAGDFMDRARSIQRVTSIRRRYAVLRDRHWRNASMRSLLFDLHHQPRPWFVPGSASYRAALVAVLGVFVVLGVVLVVMLFTDPMMGAA